MGDETKVEEGERTDQTPASKVELDVETYNALLDRVAELEDATAVPRRQSDEPSSVDELAEEARSRGRQPAIVTPPKDIDEMSNTQLAQYVFDTINQQAAERINKMEVSVETMRVLREIDKAEVKYKDFWRYGDAIKEVSTANPSLSIEDAYHLAKSRSPRAEEEGDKPQKKEPTKTEKLLNLPARTFGEKPTIAASSTRDVHRQESIRSAAERAWEEQVGKGKLTI